MTPPLPPNSTLNAPIGAAGSAASGTVAPSTVRAERRPPPMQAPRPPLPAEAAQAPQTPEPRRGLPTTAELKQAVAEVQKAVDAKTPNEIAFSLDQDTGRTVVRVIDRKTGDTIYQIPAQEMLEIAKSLDRLQGLLLKREA